MRSSNSLPNTLPGTDDVELTSQKLPGSYYLHLLITVHTSLRSFKLEYTLHMKLITFVVAIATSTHCSKEWLRENGICEGENQEPQL